MTNKEALKSLKAWKSMCESMMDETESDEVRELYSREWDEVNFCIKTIEKLNSTCRFLETLLSLRDMRADDVPDHPYLRGYNDAVKDILEKLKGDEDED